MMLCAGGAMYRCHTVECCASGDVTPCCVKVVQCTMEILWSGVQLVMWDLLLCAGGVVHSGVMCS
jgi:hypothetical protein